MSLRIILPVAMKLIPILVGLYYWSLLKKPYRLIFLQTLIAFITEWLGRYIAVGMKQGNGWLFNFYALIEIAFLMLSAILFFKSRLLKRLTFIALLIMVMIWIANMLADYTVFFSAYLILCSLAMVVLYVTVLLENLIFKSKKITLQPLFLISISIIIYYASIIPLFGAWNHLQKSDPSIAKGLYYINEVANVMRYILVAIAFYLYGKQAKRAYVAQ